MRLVHPFVRLLRRHPGAPTELLDRLEAADPDERLPIARAIELAEATLAMTGDPDLGLKAAREITAGEYGVPTGRDAVARGRPLLAADQ